MIKGITVTATIWTKREEDESLNTISTWQRENEVTTTFLRKIRETQLMIHRRECKGEFDC